MSKNINIQIYIMHTVFSQTSSMKWDIYLSIRGSLSLALWIGNVACEIHICRCEWRRNIYYSSHIYDCYYYCKQECEIILLL